MTLVFVGQCIWYILPAYVANMAPLLAAMAMKDRFAVPLDFNRKLAGRPILGSNKTYRGLVAGILGATLVSCLQTQLYAYPPVKSLSLLAYDKVNCALWGFLMGFGALCGDAAKSFVKRRRDIPPGHSWRPFDQVDFLLGALVFTSIVVVPPLSFIAGILIVMPCLKIAVAHLGYWLGWRKTKW
jgi:CDP-2,3-bis-(O-geranylgeranyl)-sn-glycerol synthase